jgi:hypothetical protein
MRLYCSPCEPSIWDAFIFPESVPREETAVSARRFNQQRDGLPKTPPAMPINAAPFKTGAASLSSGLQLYGTNGRACDWIVPSFMYQIATAPSSFGHRMSLLASELKWPAPRICQSYCRVLQTDGRPWLHAKSLAANLVIKFLAAERGPRTTARYDEFGTFFLEHAARWHRRE